MQLLQHLASATINPQSRPTFSIYCDWPGKLVDHLADLRLAYGELVPTTRFCAVMKSGWNSVFEISHQCAPEFADACLRVRRALRLAGRGNAATKAGVASFSMPTQPYWQGPLAHWKIQDIDYGVAALTISSADGAEVVITLDEPRLTQIIDVLLAVCPETTSLGLN